MDLKEYQARALETAKPTALNWGYITNNQAPLWLRDKDKK